MSRAFPVAVIGVALFTLGWIGHHILYSNQLRANSQTMATTHVRAQQAAELAKLMGEDLEGNSIAERARLGEELDDEFREERLAAEAEVMRGTSNLIKGSARIHQYGFFSLLARTVGMFAVVGAGLVIFRCSLRHRIRWRERAVLMLMPLAVLAMLLDTATTTTHYTSMSQGGAAEVQNNFLRDLLPFDPRLPDLLDFGD